MSITTEYPPAEGVIISGKTLRRNYKYEQRRVYLISNTFTNADEEATLMKTWHRDAINLYPKEGDYQKIEDVITYMGKF